MDALVNGGILVDDTGDKVYVPPVGMEVAPVRPRTDIFVWGRE
jgi:hypothetical protein